MRKSFILTASVLTFFLLSCGGAETLPNPGDTSPTTPSQDPDTARKEPEKAKVGAKIKIGSVERVFNSQSSATCLIDQTRGEAVIIFSDEQSGASLSLRMEKLDPTKTVYEMGKDGSPGSILIALGGESRRNTFRIETNSTASCKITYAMDETHLSGQLNCQGLTNRAGNSAPADGQWICNMQTNHDWHF